jgi:hypothetical protein
MITPSPRGGLKGSGYHRGVEWQNLPDSLEVDDRARADRVERRLAAVVRQLESRIAETESLRARLDQMEQRRLAAFPLRDRLVALSNLARAKVISAKASPRLSVPREAFRRLRSSRLDI